MTMSEYAPVPTIVTTCWMRKVSSKTILLMYHALKIVGSTFFWGSAERILEHTSEKVNKHYMPHKYDAPLCFKKQGAALLTFSFNNNYKGGMSFYILKSMLQYP